MKKLTRALTMGGFGVLAALAVGTAPAQASTTAGVAAESKSGAGHVAQWRDGTQVVGFYRSLRACELAGQFGERSGAWDDHDCDLVQLGVRRGTWALEVASDDDWGPAGFGRPFTVVRGFPAQFRPGWWGQIRPGHRGMFRPGHPRPFFRPGHPGPIVRPGGPVIRPGNQGPIVRPGNQGPIVRPGNQGPIGPGNQGPIVRPGHQGPGGRP
ncbi:hypothetical protein JIG36_37100 [Actinoplanes sp. LDG1-06]|uniref:Uncharacterized protein n=1 Tax=Paractinoplanes ovalisporus TaxID=2810368 RepID=A0ABS2AMP3_9ACTN|nr:hypothetical protein [Actinoplanes ovalisporus]MBM2621134.1 hypothetical protein [Actinoplanes ovalisporus]